MANNVLKISEFGVSRSASGSDRLVILKDPESVPTNKTISVNDLFGNSTANVVIRLGTPANSTIQVKAGTIMYDNEYLYVAVANNSLKRISLESF